MSEPVAIGQTVRVIAGEGGLFHGRTGRVFRVVVFSNRTNVGVMFEDGGPGSGRPFPAWFSPEELEINP